MATSWQNRALKMGFRMQALSETFAPEVNVRRGRMEMELLARASRRPSNATLTSAQIANLPSEWIIPHTPLPTRTLLYIHGGGYFFGSLNTHRQLAADMAEAVQARTLLFEYRLAPEHRFPAAFDDVLAVYRALIRDGVDPSQLILAGDSAGGGLTLVHHDRPAGCRGPPARPGHLLLALDRSGLRRRVHAEPGQGGPLVRSPPNATCRPLLPGRRDPVTPLASPLYADLHGLPPLLIQVGMDEILLSDSTRLAEKAKAAGVDVTLQVWPDMMHVWQAFARYVPEGRAALAHVAAFVQGHLPPPAVDETGQNLSYIRVAPRGQLQPIIVEAADLRHLSVGRPPPGMNPPAGHVSPINRAG